MKNNKIITCLFFFSTIIGQNSWFQGNLKDINKLSFKLNLKGIDDDAWGRRLESFFELRFLENKLLLENNQMPKLVVDINIFDSRVESVSSFLVVFSIYDYSIPESDYYKSFGSGELTKKLMTSKIFSKEIMGQSSSNNLYKDIEKNINNLISDFYDQWFKDNPIKQFEY